MTRDELARSTTLARACLALLALLALSQVLPGPAAPLAVLLLAAGVVAAAAPRTSAPGAALVALTALLVTDAAGQAVQLSWHGARDVVAALALAAVALYSRGTWRSPRSAASTSSTWRPVATSRRPSRS